MCSVLFCGQQDRGYLIEEKSHTQPLKTETKLLLVETLLIAQGAGEWPWHRNSQPLRLQEPESGCPQPHSPNASQLVIRVLDGGSSLAAITSRKRGFRRAGGEVSGHRGHPNSLVRLP
jgi:hypothetical protein